MERSFEKADREKHFGRLLRCGPIVRSAVDPTCSLEGDPARTREQYTPGWSVAIRPDFQSGPSSLRFFHRDIVRGCDPLVIRHSEITGFTFNDIVKTSPGHHLDGFLWNVAATYGKNRERHERLGPSGCVPQATLADTAGCSSCATVELFNCTIATAGFAGKQHDKKKSGRHLWVCV
ncbi:hypothetical protein D918_08779 [Trichuris suis]|nr:hypothetical protein D918_08779 [Trichuris suis]